MLLLACIEKCLTDVVTSWPWRGLAATHVDKQVVLVFTFAGDASSILLLAWNLEIAFFLLLMMTTFDFQSSIDNLLLL